MILNKVVVDELLIFRLVISLGVERKVEEAFSRSFAYLRDDELGQFGLIPVEKVSAAGLPCSRDP